MHTAPSLATLAAFILLAIVSIVGQGYLLTYAIDRDLATSAITNRQSENNPCNK